MPEKKAEHYATGTTGKPMSQEKVCPFCDHPVTKEGHEMKGDFITRCPNLGQILTPARAI